MFFFQLNRMSEIESLQTENELIKNDLEKLSAEKTAQVEYTSRLEANEAKLTSKIVNI